MKQSLLYSSLFHAALALFVFLRAAANGAPKNFFTVDLSVGSFGPSVGQNADPRGPNVAMPAENKDFLETPSSKKSAKTQVISKDQAARATPKGSGPAKSQATIGAGSGISNFPYPFYIESLRNKIAGYWDIAYWRNNLLARKAQVQFTINRDGTVGPAEFTEQSGDSLFDMACLRSVTLAAPFQPLPQGLAQEKLKIVFDFEIAP